MDQNTGLFSHLTNYASKVSLKGGVVNKICRVLIMLIVGASAVLCFVRNVWLAAFVILGVFIIVSYFLRRLCSLAENNPQVALMDGVEYLMHEQLTIQTKNGSSKTWLTSENELAGQISNDLLQDANTPDTTNIKISEEK